MYDVWLGKERMWGDSESLNSVSAKQPFTDTLTALKCADENKGCSESHQGATVAVRLVPIPSSVADIH